MTISKTAWSLENQMLFRCVQQAFVHPEVTAANGDDVFSGQPSMSNLDWDLLIDQAVDAGVESLAYLFFKDMPNVPEAAVKRLREAYFYAAAENMGYLEYAGSLFQTCTDEDIDIIALRGIAFVETLYGDIALRPVSDIDVLIRTTDQSRFESLLEALGYWQIETHAHQWTNTAIIIDVHTDLVGADRIAARDRAVRIDMDAVWESAVPVVIAGVQTRTLCWVDTLLTCSYHAIKHSCDRLLWFADLAALLEMRGVISWEMVIARARRFHLSKPTYYALAYAERTLNVAIPHEVLEELRPLHIGWLEHRCMDRVLIGEKMGRFGEVFTLFMMENTRDRLAFILETCFPKREVLGQAYGTGAMKTLPARSRRLWHVADMAFDVLKHGLHRAPNGHSENGHSPEIPNHNNNGNHVNDGVNGRLEIKRN